MAKKPPWREIVCMTDLPHEIAGCPQTGARSPRADAGSTRFSIAPFATRRWKPRSILWLGGLFIAIFIALAAYDIVMGYRAALSDTGRRLESQARVIAEQTSRSLQAVDVVLRHLVERIDDGPLAAHTASDLRNYLREQSVGMVQIDGLLIVNADGSIRASSYLVASEEAALNLNALPPFQALRADANTIVFVGAARKSAIDGQWIFPIARRLQSPSGQFTGMVAARGRIDYFQQFYKDLRLDRGTKVSLTQEDGTLIARYPALESALGQPVASYGEVRAAYDAGRPDPMRAISPLDGVERFGAIHPVAGYPLSVTVVQDVSLALAPWREQALGTAVRTLALGGLAALLLAIALRQVRRLHAARESLEVSRERYSLAVAGSDDGLWDIDFGANRIFVSSRCREILGLAQGPEVQRLDDWLASIEFHPDDARARHEAIADHVAGRTPFYQGETRVRQPDGSYRWVRFRGLCVRDLDGRPYRMAGSVSDIDARKRAEDSLRESEERFALAVAGSSDGMLDWDLVNDRMFTSERAMRIVGIDSTITVRSRAEWVRLLKHPPRRRRGLQRGMAAPPRRPDRGARRRIPPDASRRHLSLGARARNVRARRRRQADPLGRFGHRHRRAEARRRSAAPSEERYQLAVVGSNRGPVGLGPRDATSCSCRRARRS